MAVPVQLVLDLLAKRLLLLVLTGVGVGMGMLIRSGLATGSTLGRRGLAVDTLRLEKTCRVC